MSIEDYIPAMVIGMVFAAAAIAGYAGEMLSLLFPGF